MTERKRRFTALPPACCAEAGTLSLSRQDITDAMLHCKRAAPRHVAVELARALSGPGRQDQLRLRVGPPRP